MFKNKRVLVTGGAGVIGKELIQLLKERGAIIRCVDLAEKPKELEDIEYYRLDLSNSDSQFLFRFNPEYVFHLAADYERSIETPEFWESNFRNNILCSHYVISEVMKCSSIKRIIFASSYLIYDKNLYSKDENVCYLKEDSRINPRNLCGIAKLQTEADLFFLSEINQMTFAAARIYRVYGKGSGDVISRWVRYALDNRELKVFSPDNEFDYIYAKDVAIGLVKLCESNFSGIINLGTGIPTKIKDIISILKEEFADLKVKEVDMEILKEKSCADVTKLKSVLNWTPTTSVKEGIKELIKYEREHKIIGRFDEI